MRPKKEAKSDGKRPNSVHNFIGVLRKDFFRLKIDVIRPNILQRNHEIAELAMCTLQYDESSLFFMWHAIKHNVTSV